MTDPLSNVLGKLERVKSSGKGWIARCPGHDDRQNSLSVGVADDGKVLLHCHAQCPPERVLDALGLRMSDLFPPEDSRRNAPVATARKAPGGSRGTIAATYNYVNEDGELLFQAVRYDRKGFSQRRPNGHGGWINNLDGVELVPYRLSELRVADADRMVLVTEGEKDCDRLTELEFVATTNAGGAGKWRPQYSEELRGRKVALLPDNDNAGHEHMERVASALSGIAKEVRIVRLPDLPVKGDVSDWLNQGGTKKELQQIIKATPVWLPSAKVNPSDDDSDASADNVTVFPLDVLPPKVRAYVQAAADSLSVPAEMVAAPLLGLAGALVGSRFHLVLKNSWREYPTLYLAIVAPPGAAKSPALNLAKWPLDALQKAAYERHARQFAEYEAEHTRWKAKGKKQGEPEPVKPRLQHYFSTDPTIEALAEILEGAPGAAVIRDEISGWVAAMDQYKGGGKGSERQQYLSLWSGQAIKADRKNGGSVYVPEPVACVVGGIQPDLAGTLHSPTQRRDGFVERVLPLVPYVGPAQWTDAAPTTEHYRDVLDVFQALDALSYPTEGEGTGLSRGHGVNLSREARTAFISWHDENARLVAEAEGLAKGFYSKLPAHVARLALILHTLWHADDPRVMVSGERMQDAIELGEFFRAHIGRFLALLQASAPVGSAGLDARIMRKMRHAGEAEEWVSRSSIYRGLRRTTPAELTTALNKLVDAGAIERQTAPSATKPAENYRCRMSHYSHFSHFSGPPEPETTANGPNEGENANNATCDTPIFADRAAAEHTPESKMPDPTPLTRERSNARADQILEPLPPDIAETVALFREKFTDDELPQLRAEMNAEPDEWSAAEHAALTHLERESLRPLDFLDVELIDDRWSEEPVA